MLLQANEEGEGSTANTCGTAQRSFGTVGFASHGLQEHCMFPGLGSLGY